MQSIVCNSLSSAYTPSGSHPSSDEGIISRCMTALRRIWLSAPIFMPKPMPATAVNASSTGTQTIYFGVLDIAYLFT